MGTGKKDAKKKRKEKVKQERLERIEKQKQELHEKGDIAGIEADIARLESIPFLDPGQKKKKLKLEEDAAEWKRFQEEIRLAEEEAAAAEAAVLESSSDEEDEAQTTTTVGLALGGAWASALQPQSSSHAPVVSAPRQTLTPIPARAGPATSATGPTGPSLIPAALRRKRPRDLSALSEQPHAQGNGIPPKIVQPLVGAATTGATAAQTAKDMEDLLDLLAGDDSDEEDE
jgi:hypothetical protein